MILAVNLYCKIPFGKIHVRNPDIIHLADVLGRTPGSVSYKLANFASIDPTLERIGAKNVSKLDRAVWDEFFADWESLVYESELQMAELGMADEPEPTPAKTGTMRSATVKVRINQDFFRKMILSSYNGACCITGIDNRELLVASHIVPWSQDAKNRLNPMNGLCLNALHDRAFDAGLISLDDDYRVMVSKRVRHDLLGAYDRKPIRLPGRFLPDRRFIAFHRVQVFRGAVNDRLNGTSAKGVQGCLDPLFN